MGPSADDEPTNHLDAESVAWLEHHLREYKGTVIAVTHDRYVLDNVAGWILELDRGFGIPYKGNYSSWLEQKETRLAQEEKAESQRQKSLARELEWIRMSPKARQSKGKARVTSYELLLGQEAEKRREELDIYIPPGPRLGDVVFEFDKVTKSYDDRLILDSFSAAIQPGSIIGIIGQNGAGKTTLLRMIAGTEKPDSGSIKSGETVKLAYADQSRTLDPEKTVYEEISQGADFLELGKRKINSRGYCSSFNFMGADQQKKVGVLSGGERNRVHLAKTLTEGANVLLLERLKGHDSVARRQRLEKSQWWSVDRISEEQALRLRDFLVGIGARAPYYRDLSRRLGFDPASVRTTADLSLLPLLGKPDIRANVERLKADGHGPLTRLNTGGSSGEPLIFYMGKGRKSHDVAAKWRATRWWDVDIGDRELVVWGSPIELGAQDHRFDVCATES